eukprot:2483617-Amphidinium_carterae.1
MPLPSLLRLVWRFLFATAVISPSIELVCPPSLVSNLANLLLTAALVLPASSVSSYPSTFVCRNTCIRSMSHGVTA